MLTEAANKLPAAGMRRIVCCWVLSRGPEGPLRPEKPGVAGSSGGSSGTKAAGAAHGVPHLLVAGLQHAVNDVVLHRRVRIEVLWPLDVLGYLLRVVLGVL